VWHGCPDRTLIEQTYPGMEDHKRHFYQVLKAFSDERYVTVNGKPMFLIYHPNDIPDIERVVDFWRELALKSGLKGLHLVGVSHNTYWNPEQYGFDACVSQKLPPLTKCVSPQLRLLKLYSFLKNRRLPTVYSYKEIVNFIVQKKKPAYEDYSCIIPNWDNTPRSEVNGLVLHESTPAFFGEQVRAAVNIVLPQPEERRLIFLKSWNEWAEGNHMEPDMKFGRGYLEALKKEISSSPPVFHTSPIELSLKGNSLC